MAEVKIADDLLKEYKGLKSLVRCESIQPDPEWFKRIEEIERVSNAEAELTRIKNGGGWYEDTPGGARKFCTVSEEQEVKTATEQVNTFRKLCEMMLIALRLHAGDLESGLIHRAREVLK